MTGSNEAYAQYTENGYEDLRENAGFLYAGDSPKRWGSWQLKIRSHAQGRLSPEERREANSRFDFASDRPGLCFPAFIGRGGQWRVRHFDWRWSLLPFLAIFVSGVVAFALIVSSLRLHRSGGRNFWFPIRLWTFLAMGIGGLLLAVGISVLHFYRLAGLREFYHGFS